MANRTIFLGFPLSADSPNPPAIPKLELSPFLSLKNGNEANVTMLKVTTHTGSHVDAPCHVIEGGISISDFRPDEFIFTHPAVLDLRLNDEVVVQPEHLEPFVEQAKSADLLLFRYGYGLVRRTDPKRYSMKCPGFGVESAQYLVRNFPAVRAMGMDVPSLSCIAYLDKTMAAHNILLAGNGGRFLVIEDMNLEHDLSHLKTVILAPWLIAGLDGGPATIFGMLD
jgi:kynurenine formamidase